MIGLVLMVRLMLKEPENSGILQKQSDTSYRRQGPTQKRKAEQEATRIQSATAITLFFRVFKQSEYTHPFLDARRCHTARGLPPPTGLLGAIGVVTRR
jgi:hypothetical protein